MKIVENYKALVFKELPKNGNAIYVFIAYNSWGKPDLHYSRSPHLYPPETTMEDILAQFQSDITKAFREDFYKGHRLMDAQLIMTDPGALSLEQPETY